MLALHRPVGGDVPLHPDLLLQCPRCRSNINGMKCRVCAFRMEMIREIVHAMLPERTAYYVKFMEDYEHIRAAEGRGSERKEFYLGLPYADVTGMNSTQWHIRARSYDYLVKHVLAPMSRHREGRILDLGAGNCWMSFRLALAGYRPVAVDLLTNDQDGLGAAAHYRERLRELFPRFQAEVVRLPFQSEQFDAVVFNASFHYSEDYEQTMREALRCVKTGGMVVISDTPWYSSETSGKQMVSERRATFLRKYGTASDSVRSIQYLTDERLRALEEQFSIQWAVSFPYYGIKWAMRPFVAMLRNQREPSRFRIYAARKNAFEKL